MQTKELLAGDVVLYAGGRATVTALRDTGRAAIFGAGTEWHIALGTTGGDMELSAASGHTWTRL